MSNVYLKPATEDDVPVVFSLLQQMAADDAHGPELHATPERLRETLFGADPPAFVLLAYAEDEPVGYASYFRTYSTYLARPGLWIDDLFVVRAWRGQGIGQKMFNHLAQQVVDSNGGRLEWHANHENEGGLKFYARNGAEILQGVHTLRLTGDMLAVAAGR